MLNNQFISPIIYNELLSRLASLENEIKLLKEENKNLKNEINILKESSIREKLDTLYPKDLKFNNIFFDKNGYLLNTEDSFQFGSYKKYKEGKYCIIYYGINLSKLFYDCYDDEGKNILNISLVFKSSDKYVYDVFIPENNKCIEFRVKENKNFNSLIEKLKFSGININ